MSLLGLRTAYACYDCLGQVAHPPAHLSAQPPKPKLQLIDLSKVDHLGLNSEKIQFKGMHAHAKALQGVTQERFERARAMWGNHKKEFESQMSPAELQRGFNAVMDARRDACIENESQRLNSDVFSFTYYDPKKNWFVCLILSIFNYIGFNTGYVEVEVAKGQILYVKVDLEKVERALNFVYLSQAEMCSRPEFRPWGTVDPKVGLQADHALLMPTRSADQTDAMYNTRRIQHIVHLLDQNKAAAAILTKALDPSIKDYPDLSPIRRSVY